jgi:hypothetical protein
MHRELNPQDLLLRAVFAAAALLATIGTGAFIDALATGYSAGAEAAAQAPTRVAATER